MAASERTLTSPLNGALLPDFSHPQPVRSAGRWLSSCAYAVGWPDGVVKVGCTWQKSRWRSFELRGGQLIRLYWAKIREAHYIEQGLLADLAAEFPAAFTDKSESLAYMGVTGAGWTECYRVPACDWEAVFSRDVTVPNLGRYDY